MQDTTQTLLKGYTLHTKVAEGGFGAVYRATQEIIGRDVAVKVILPKWGGDADFIWRFEAEARLVAHLEHPYIVPLYDYWRDPTGAYLVMRWMAGGSLLQLLHQHAPTPAIAFRIFEQIAGALSFAHRRNVIHRDLKPANILLDSDGDAYLADFGIAKDVLTAGDLLSERPSYTPGYAAPEQILIAPATPQTDIYSLGVLLYELITGARAYQGTTANEIVSRQLVEQPPPVRNLRPHLPVALDMSIQRATSRDPAARYPDVASFLEDVRRGFVPFLEGGVVAAPVRAVPSAGMVSGTVALDALDFENPYKGLRAFQEADSADFFGREALIRRLLERLGAPQGPQSTRRLEEETMRPDMPRFLAVVGPSGSGKSSVVRAGLVPSIRRGGLPGSHRWFLVDFTPGDQPLAELEAALLRVAANPPANLREQLLVDTQGLHRVVQQILPTDRRVELLLVIDQFEELFTQSDEQIRMHLLRSLAAALQNADSRLRVIVTLRADFYGRPLSDPDFGELMRHHTEVALPLSMAELEQAITRPAARAGMHVEPALVTAIQQEVGAQPGALPLLQYALTELFDRRSGPVLLLSEYQAGGGVQGALARRADELYSALDATGQEAVRQLFLRLVTPGEGAEDTRRRVALSELQIAADHAQQQAVIDLYGRHRLLTFDRDPLTRTPTIEVAHEALIRSWGRLRQWLDSARDDVRTQRRLSQAAAEWIGDNRDPDELARGARLTQFDAWASMTTLLLNDDERAYLEAIRIDDNPATRGSLLSSLDESRRMIAVLRGHTNEINAATFSPDGKTIASAGNDGKVRIWNTATGTLLGAPLTGDLVIIFGLAYSPDGNTLATAGYRPGKVGDVSEVVFL